MRTLDDLGDLDGKRVSSASTSTSRLKDGVIGDDARIRAALPTLEELRRRGARLLLAAHLGRPKGRDLDFSSRRSRRADRAAGRRRHARGDLDHVPDGDVVMLENVRFEPGETKDDPALAARYAALADAYVDDAFGAAHRAHASTHAIAKLLPSAAGLLLQREVETLQGILADPPRPLVAIVGGAKVTDKIGVLEAFLERRHVLIGGAMCFPFFKAQGHSVGASLCEEEGIAPAERVLAGRRQVQLPVDLVCGEAFDADTPVTEVDGVTSPTAHGPRRGPAHRGRLRRGHRGRRDGVLERPDGRVRAGAVRGRHARGRRGGRGRPGDDRRRRRRQRRGAAAVRARGRGDAPLNRRRRSLELIEGKTLPGVEVLS